MNNNQQVLGTEPIREITNKILSTSNNWYDGKWIIQCSR